MQVWEAINILESLDPKSEVTLGFGNQVKSKSPNFIRDYVINREHWVTVPTPPESTWYKTNINCRTVH